MARAGVSKVTGGQGPSTFAAQVKTVPQPAAALPPPGAPTGEAGDDFKPYIPASTVLPEMTVKVFVVGILLAWIMSSANAYLGLFAGLTVSAAIPASVISMAVFRFFRNRNILENNLVQTTASAGESVTAGIIFSLPALILIKHWETIGIWETIIIAALGGSLGVLFTIPLRRAFIVDAKLQYPEGVATVEVLKSGEKGGTGVGFILLSGVLGALYKMSSLGLGLWAELTQWARRIGSTGFYFAVNMSPALVGVGFIIGLPIAILIFVGGVMGYVIATPTWLALNPWPTYCEPPFHTPEFCRRAFVPLTGEEMSPLHAFSQVRDYYVRYIGVGGMAAGGVYTLYRLRGALVRGVKSGMDAYRAIKSAGGDTRVRTERDINMKTVLITTAIFTVPLTGLFTYFVTDRFNDFTFVWVGPVLALIMLAAGFLFSAVAGYMAGVVGSSNNPISGTGIGTILVTALLLVAFGLPANVGPAAAILIAGTIMAAAAIAGDNMQDLKAGYLLGGTPKNLQIMQMVGAIAAAISIPFVLILLHSAFPIGEKLEAPQSQLMASLASGIFGGEIRWDAFWIGVALAAVIIALDKFLEIRKARFRTPVLAIAIGIYLPFHLATPIFIGGLIWWGARALMRRSARRTLPEAEPEQIHGLVESRTNRGVLFASGLIAGEALTGIIIAALVVLKVPLLEGHAEWPGLLVLLYLALLMGYIVWRGRPRREELPQPGQTVHKAGH